jgi:hypothetical protein
MNKTIVPKLIGGLGNQLFIMASATDVANRWNSCIVFHDKPGNPHCPDDLSMSVLFPNVPITKNIQIDGEVAGSDFTYRDMVSSIPPGSRCIFVSGYNQSPRYIPYNFCTFLNHIPNLELGDMQNIAYLHVRRGDYVNHPIFKIDHKTYYRTAVSDLVKKNPEVKILILSDDLNWSNQNIPPLLEGIVSMRQFIFLHRNYPAAYILKLMTRCLAGAVCANSSFSWWGAFGNKQRPIYMPHPWSSYDVSTTLDLYFEEVTKVSSITGDILL